MSTGLRRHQVDSGSVAVWLARWSSCGLVAREREVLRREEREERDEHEQRRKALTTEGQGSGAESGSSRMNINCESEACPGGNRWSMRAVHVFLIGNIELIIYHLRASCADTDMIILFVWWRGGRRNGMEEVVLAVVVVVVDLLIQQISCRLWRVTVGEPGDTLQQVSE